MALPQPTGQAAPGPNRDAAVERSARPVDSYGAGCQLCLYSAHCLEQCAVFNVASTPFLMQKRNCQSAHVRWGTVTDGIRSCSAPMWCCNCLCLDAFGFGQHRSFGRRAGASSSCYSSARTSAGGAWDRGGTDTWDRRRARAWDRRTGTRYGGGAPTANGRRTSTSTRGGRAL